MDRQTLEKNLAQFHGTDAWHRWSILYPRFYLTDGAKYLADNAGAYWLMDVIASWQLDKKVRIEPFQVWEMQKDMSTGKATITCDDGNGRVLTQQVVEYTDFPLPKIKLYAVYDGEHLVILLPGEY